MYMIETSGQLFHSFFSCIFSLHDFVIMDIIYKHSFLSKQNITVLIWKRHFKYHKKLSLRLFTGMSQMQDKSC